MTKPKIIKISLTEHEAFLIEYVFDKVWEWAVNDTRPDHGLGKLQYFKENDESKQLLELYSKFRRNRFKRTELK